MVPIIFPLGILDTLQIRAVFRVGLRFDNRLSLSRDYYYYYYYKVNLSIYSPVFISQNEMLICRFFVLMSILKLISIFESESK
jgi:hypothetical protein